MKAVRSVMAHRCSERADANDTLQYSDARFPSSPLKKSGADPRVDKNRVRIGDLTKQPEIL